MTVEGKKDDAVGPDKGNKPPVVTVVLTPGRSGSSLLMEVLSNLGARLSDDLIPGRLENPHGFFEDAQLVEIHKGLISELGTRPGFPMPEGWLDQQVTRKAKRALTDLVRQQASAGPAGWAIKDPRICELLPLWVQVFNSAGVTPRFILALRDPAAVGTSLLRGINRDERLTELQWLYRTSQALYHSAADCFVLHYEDWFERPGVLARGLAIHCGLGDIQEEQAHEAVQGVLEERLDRSSWQHYQVHHPLVKKLYAALRDCRGTKFDHTALLAKVRDASSLVDGFRYWAEGNKAIKLAWKREKEAWRTGGADGRGANETESDGAPKEIADNEQHSARVTRNSANKNREKAMKQASQSAGKDETPENTQDSPQSQEKLTGLRQALEAKEDALFGLRRNLEELTLQNSRYLNELRNQYDRIEELRKRNTALTQEKHQLTQRVRRSKKKAVKKKTGNFGGVYPSENMADEIRSVQRLKREVKSLRNSYSFRIGQAFADGLMKPGANTVKLPFRVIALLFSAFRNRNSIGRTN